MRRGRRMTGCYHGLRSADSSCASANAAGQGQEGGGQIAFERNTPTHLYVLPLHPKAHQKVVG